MKKLKCAICGTPIPENDDFGYCPYCGHDIVSYTDESDTNPFINPYHKENLLNKIKSVELKTYRFDGKQCIPSYQYLGTGAQILKKYVFIDDFIENNPGTIQSITIRINEKKEVEIPIQVPITLKPLRIGIQITDTLRLQAIMENEYRSSQSSLIDIYHKGEI